MDEKAFNYEDEKYHKIIDNIGESFTSIIYKIIDTKTQKVMRKNVLKCDSEQVTFKDLQNAIKEFEFLHPCICYAIGINPSERNPDSDDKESPTVALFLEFADCKLADCQKKKKKKRNSTLKTKIVLEIVHGMSYIHQHGIIHPNLNIDSIMLDLNYNKCILYISIYFIYKSNLINEYDLGASTSLRQILDC